MSVLLRLVGFAVLIGLAGTAAAHDDGVAARVNGTTITDAMVNNVVKGVIAGRQAPPNSEEIEQLTAAALESLIDLELLYQVAPSQQITVSDQEIDAEIARSRRSFADDKAFNAALKQSGLSAQQLRDETRKTLLVNKFLTDVVWKGVEVKPETMQKFYDQHHAEFAQASPTGKAPPYDSVKKWIHKTLLEQAREERQRAYVADIKQTAKIERMGPTPKK